MSRDPRDWQADMERVERFNYAQTLCNWPKFIPHGFTENDIPEPPEVALEYWLQEAKAEKDRADRAETKLDANQYLTERAERITKDIKERERKLKEAMESEIEYFFSELEFFKADRLHKVLSTLYPLERKDTNDN